MITLTIEECKAVYDLMDQVSGGNAKNVFVWDGTDDINDPTTSLAVKIFKAIGRDIPENL